MVRGSDHMRAHVRCEEGNPTPPHPTRPACVSRRAGDVVRGSRRHQARGHGPRKRTRRSRGVGASWVAVAREATGHVAHGGRYGGEGKKNLFFCDWRPGPGRRINGQQRLDEAAAPHRTVGWPPAAVGRVAA